MMDQFTFGEMKLTWLDAGITALDGGAMFGVVPRGLWKRKYPANELNQIELVCESILIQYNGKNYLIDSGVGTKLTDKQLRNYGVYEQSKVEESLANLNLTVQDIDAILMTHMHFDHAGGLTKFEGDKLVPVFPNAKIFVTEIEWNEMRNPNIRSRNTYWKENWEPIAHLVETYVDQLEVAPGITLQHTGGHSEGHAIIRLEQDGETILHMGDILPTHGHLNPLWVTAYDDYPMTSIFTKEKILKEAFENGYTFTFYHDAYYRMIKWDETGKEMIFTLPRTKKPNIPYQI